MTWQRQHGDFALLDERDRANGPRVRQANRRPRMHVFRFTVTKSAGAAGAFALPTSRRRAGLYTVGFEDEGKVRVHPLSRQSVRNGSAVWRSQLDSLVPLRCGRVRHGRLCENAAELRHRRSQGRGLFQRLAARSEGKPRELPRAIALYERDGGVLWRHGRNSRRARQLVLSSFVRVDEYDYGFNWIFHEDGTLAMEVLLTGRMNVKLVERKEDEDGA